MPAPLPKQAAARRSIEKNGRCRRSGPSVPPPGNQGNIMPRIVKYSPGAMAADAGTVMTHAAAMRIT